MSRFDDIERHEPDMPGFTCPDIDEVIKTVKDLMSTLDSLTGRWGSMESIRSANQELRASAEYWKEAAKELSGELDTANERIAELEGQLEEAREKEAA